MIQAMAPGKQNSDIDFNTKIKKSLLVNVFIC